MFSGSLVALITPMKANGSIDYPALSKLIAWHVEAGTDGLVVLGTTGESATILGKERAQLIEFAVKEVAQRMPVIVGAGTNCTQQSIEYGKEAMQLGVDAVFLVTPYYNKPSQEGLYQHYAAIAQHVPVPQILYNVPSRTCCDLLPSTVGRLSRFANIVAVKEATGSIERLQELLALDSHMSFLSGDDNTALAFMRAGGKGVISVAANVIPQAFHELCAAALAGNVKQASTINEQFHKLYRDLFIEPSPSPTKYLLHKMGLIDAGIRLPLTPLSSECMATLDAWLPMLATRALH